MRLKRRVSKNHNIHEESVRLVLFKYLTIFCLTCSIQELKINSNSWSL